MRHELRYGDAVAIRSGDGSFEDSIGVVAKVGHSIIEVRRTLSKSESYDRESVIPFRAAFIEMTEKQAKESFEEVQVSPKEKEVTKAPRPLRKGTCEECQKEWSEPSKRGRMSKLCPECKGE